MSVEIQPHEPGRARRFVHENRESYIKAQESIAAKAPPIALDKFQLSDALNYWPNLKTEAVPKLTGTEARLLSVYLSVIPWEDIQAGKAMGSMSIAMLGARLGIADPRRVRELRSNLERKGAAWRDYNGANYQAPREGFDLSAFLAMARIVYAELQAAVAAVYARRDIAKAIMEGGSKAPGGRVEPTRLIQASSQPPRGRGEEVQGKAESGWSPDDRRRGKPYGASTNAGSNGTTESCSAGRASVSDGVKPAAPEEAAIIVAALSAARQASKSLRAATSHADIDRLNLAALCTSIVRALPTIAPGFPVKTFEWAWREHSWRSIPALAVALDDPTTGNQAALLGAWVRGHFTTRDDWASNFKRMIRSEEEAALAAGVATPAVPTSPPAAGGSAPPPQISAPRLEAATTYLNRLDPFAKVKWGDRAKALGAPAGPAERWAAWIIDELPKGWSS